MSSERRRFRLRKQHVEAMTKAAEGPFIEDVCKHLRDNHPDKVAPLPDDKLRKRVEVGLARAKSHALSMQDTLTAFIALMFSVAPNFDEHVVARRILTAETKDPDSRLDNLMEQMTEEHWNQAKAASSDKAWGEAA